MRHHWLTILFAGLLLGGCASTLPQALTRAQVEPISVSQARDEPDTHRGQPVRWGGIIVDVTNRRDATWVEVLSRPLDSDQRPDPDGGSGPRFLARLPGFVDPAEYAPDRLLTLVGQLTGVREQNIGEYPYRYPVLEVGAHHLWPEPAQPRHPPRAPWHSPWYGPWHYPWYDPWFHRRHW